VIRIYISDFIGIDVDVELTVQDQLSGKQNLELVKFGDLNMEDVDVSARA
jgi:hypothetical protein